jgi:hypothetical protein
LKKWAKARVNVAGCWCGLPVACCLLPVGAAFFACADKYFRQSTLKYKVLFDTFTETDSQKEFPWRAVTERFNNSRSYYDTDEQLNFTKSARHAG